MRKHWSPVARRLMSALARSRDFFANKKIFSQVVLTVSNSSSASKGVLQVIKGCGRNASLADLYSKADFDSDRQCFVSLISNSSRTIGDLGSLPPNGSVLTGPSEAGTLSWSQEELCFCKGSQCNQGCSPSLASILLLLSGLLIFLTPIN